MDANKVLGEVEQKLRFLIAGATGQLTKQQIPLAKDILKDVEALKSAIGKRKASELASVSSSRFDLSESVKFVVSRIRFRAKARGVSVITLGGSSSLWVCANQEIFEGMLLDALTKAIDATAPKSQVHIELTRSADRLAVDVLARDWKPAVRDMFAPIPKGASLAASILRTATGSRFVISMPASDEKEKMNA